MNADDLKQKSVALFDYFKPRNEMFKAMDRYANSIWELPPALAKKDGMHKTVSSDPHDALRAATQILSTIEPHFQITPPFDDPEVKEYCNQIETYIRYVYQQAERRNQITADVIRSLLQYGMVAVQTYSLEYQQKIKKTMSDARLKAALRNGAFSVIVRKPSDVYPVISENGLESVLLTKVYNVNEFTKTWGEFDFIHPDDATMEYVMVYDYMDYERRIVLAKQSVSTDVAVEIADGQTILDVENDLGFLPWDVRMVGPSFYDDPKEKLSPLLKPLYDTGLWDTQNTMLTLLSSSAIQYHAAPQLVIQGPGANEVEVDYDEINNPIRSETPATLQRIEPLRRPEMDSSMMTSLEMISAAIGKQTVARFIQNPEMKADVPFSSMNLIFQLGANTINPHKMVAQECIAEIGRQFLMWTKLNGEKQVVFDKKRDDRGLSVGRSIVIDPMMIDEDANIQVELTADVPTDRMQKVNAAVMMAQNLHVPLIRLLEQVGFADPEQALKEYETQLQMENELQIALQERQAESQMNMHAKAMQLQQMQMQLQQPVQPGVFDNAGGMGFNPAMGGTPPAQAAPGFTREQITQQTKSGDGMGLM